MTENCLLQIFHFFDLFPTPNRGFVITLKYFPKLCKQMLHKLCNCRNLDSESTSKRNIVDKKGWFCQENGSKTRTCRSNYYLFIEERSQTSWQWVFSLRFNFGREVSKESNSTSISSSLLFSTWTLCPRYVEKINQSLFRFIIQKVNLQEHIILDFQGLVNPGPNSSLNLWKIWNPDYNPKAQI